jgi:FAD:protein FMN transferase
VQFQRQGMELDFGGLAKGHAAKRVARVLQKQGVSAALVNLGSSSLCASEVTPSAAALKSHRETGVEIGEWPIGVAHPSNATQCPVYLLLKPGWALSTSGTYEQQFKVDGKKFSHILDPRTGWPLNGLRSVTAVTRSGRRSEALTKQLLILLSVERAALGQRFKNIEWAHLEVSQTGALAIDMNARRTNLLASSNRQA